MTQFGDHNGFFNGTPGTRSSLTVRFVPPSLLVSVINGRNGCPPCKRTTAEVDQPPMIVFTTFGVSLSNWRPFPNGRSYRIEEEKLCLMSKVEIARSPLRGPP